MTEMTQAMADLVLDMIGKDELIVLRKLCKTLGQPETRFPYTLHHDFVRSKWIHGISRSDVAQMTDGEPIQHLARVAVAKAAMDAEPISLLVLERSDRKVALACLIWADWYVNDKMATKLSDR